MTNHACLIALTQGKFATVSPEDYEFLSQFKWCAIKERASYGFRWRAIRRSWPDNETIYMHREVAARCGLYSRYYDHKDRDGLNNARDNIRPCNGTQNNANQAKNRSKSSKFKGVYWDKSTQKWRSRIAAYGKVFNLGRFTDEADAGAAYRSASMRLFGEFSCFD